ncbi:unnamed protein product [marine sediment metagenome]|uniref:Rubrerythrin diiron-binding domain-containing protein n=1 Tax=marine sediment metagenome TaxID=412755 RepID=X1LTH9_9ZZZZ
MGTTFNADEIFEMAEEIERNGAMFYREAAANTSDNETKRKLRRLSEHLAAPGPLHILYPVELRSGESSP